jgi:hypothetical protein
VSHIGQQLTARHAELVRELGDGESTRQVPRDFAFPSRRLLDESAYRSRAGTGGAAGKRELAIDPGGRDGPAGAVDEVADVGSGAE